MKQIYRTDLGELKPYKPGLTIEDIKEKYGLDNVIKLASNENPLGTPPLAQKAIERAKGLAFRYPQNYTPRLATALAKYLGVDPDRLLVANGSDEVLDLIVRFRARPGIDHVLTYKGGFSMYPMLAKMCGVGFTAVDRASDFSVSLDNLADAANENTAVIFIANPDNPTGTAFTKAQLEAFLTRIPETTLVVMDQAYVEFSTPQEDYSFVDILNKYDNLVISRTFSKAYGLAGLRIGYGVLPLWFSDIIRRGRIPFSVNLLAEEAGVAALEDFMFLKTTLETVAQGKEYLTAEFENLGCEVLPSQSNFLMVKPCVDAFDLYESLLKRGLIVRHLASFGFKDHIRVNMGRMDENKIFIRTVKEIING